MEMTPGPRAHMAPTAILANIASNTPKVKESQLRSDIRKFAENLQRLEILGEHLAELSDAVDRAIAVETSLKKLQWQLITIRSQHDVLQRLFEPLRAELIKYKDAFVREVLQKALVQDLVRLDDDLRSVLDTIKRAAEVKRGRVAKWARGMDCSMENLTAILGRLKVSEVEPQSTVNPAVHRVVSYEPTENLTEDGKIVAHVKRGLLWHDQIMRREEVIAKRFR
jgi:molecular chaperone GrpE (heat shock protein)